jgi:hypothetical protein
MSELLYHVHTCCNNLYVDLCIFSSSFISPLVFLIGCADVLFSCLHLPYLYSDAMLKYPCFMFLPDILHCLLSTICQMLMTNTKWHNVLVPSRTTSSCILLFLTYIFLELSSSSMLQELIHLPGAQELSLITL